MKSHTLNLTKGAIMLARALLAQPGWSETPTDAYQAFKLLEEKLPELPPFSKDEATAKAEMREVLPIDIGEKARETFKTCVRALLKKGIVSPGQPIGNLVAELGLVEEE